MLFQFTKVTTASLHTTQEYQPCHGFLWVFAEPPADRSGQPGRSGPNHFLPSPRRAFKSAAAPSQRQPQPLYPTSFPSEPLISIPKNHLLSQPHLTIDRRRSQQHTQEVNRITVYPFTYKRVNRYLKILWAENTSSAHNILSLKSESCDNTEENIHDVEWNKCYNISVATLILFLTAK